MTSSFDEEKALELESLVALTLSFSDLNYSVPNRETPIIQGINGTLVSGELTAILGPSGAGKSTFLDVLCRRVATTGSILLNGSADWNPSDVISFVEQDDALFGVLTVRETVAYAAYLSLPRDTPELENHIDATLRALGLQDVANNRIGTPLQRGISGGQKRRTSIACSMVARPRVLVCDEPTSGLDSTSSLEVIKSLQLLARRTSTIVICSIHQPNYDTFSLFDNLLLLAGGRVMYNGPVKSLDRYLAAVGHSTPQHQSPSDHAINLVNTEFYTASDGVQAGEHLDRIAELWTNKGSEFAQVPNQLSEQVVFARKTAGVGRDMHKLRVLTQRNFRLYSRNILAFGIRMGMYAAMGLLLATIWIRLGTSTNKIQDRLSVHFFSVAFLGFMSVSGIPAFLEERAVFIRERGNGLYGSGIWTIANTVAVFPFLFACTTVFACISYFAIGLNQQGATPFFRFLLYLFLGVFAAESQSMVVAAAIPIFVAALAIASFMNGFLMCVQGYFIRATSLPRFWYYTAHFIDYQTFAFELLVRNDVQGLEFQCPIIDGVCSCPFASTIESATNCAVAGNDLLVNLDYAGVSDGLYVGILVIIIVVYRLAMWGVLAWRKK